MSGFVQSGRFGAAAWTPASLSPALWLDASDASSFTYHSGTIVSQWNDLSGSNRHATQATSGNAPTRATTLNGLSTVDFDGTDDWMTCGDVLDLGTSNITVYAAVKFDTLAASAQGRTVIGKYKVTSADGSWLMLNEYATTTKMRSVYDAGTLTVATSATYADTTGTLLGMIVDRAAGTITQRVDGATNGTASFTPDSGSSRNIATSVYIGALRDAADTGFTANYWFNGQIAEVVVCLSALSTTDRDLLESYLNAKWAIY